MRRVLALGLLLVVVACGADGEPDPVPSPLDNSPPPGRTIGVTGPL